MSAAGTCRVRAPGKLMLAGEYAVLTGAPAIVACVDRYVSVDCAPCDDGFGEVVMPGFDSAAYRYRVEGGALRWAAGAPSLALVSAVLRACPPLRPLRLRIDSSALYDGGRKLGLGSSAAVAVATAAAVRGVSDPVRALGAALRAHDDYQGGAGSGADVRAIAHGGVIAQQGTGGDAAVHRLHWPGSLHAAAVFADRAADTVDRIRRFTRWRNDAADAASVLETAARAAEHVLAEWRRADATAIIAAMEAYTDEIGRIDRAAGLGYHDGGHAALADLARESGCVYKPCGAGGGDLGVAFAADRAPLDAFGAAANRAGFRVPPLTIGRATPHVTPGAAA